MNDNTPESATPAGGTASENKTRTPSTRPGSSTNGDGAQQSTPQMPMLQMPQGVDRPTTSGQGARQPATPNQSPGESQRRVSGQNTTPTRVPGEAPRPTQSPGQAPVTPAPTAPARGVVQSPPQKPAAVPPAPGASTPAAPVPPAVSTAPGSPESAAPAPANLLFLNWAVYRTGDRPDADYGVYESCGVGEPLQREITDVLKRLVHPQKYPPFPRELPFYLFWESQLEQGIWIFGRVTRQIGAEKRIALRYALVCLTTSDLNQLNGNPFNATEYNLAEEELKQLDVFDLIQAIIDSAQQGTPFETVPVPLVGYHPSIGVMSCDPDLMQRFHSVRQQYRGQALTHDEAMVNGLNNYVSSARFHENPEGFITGLAEYLETSAEKRPELEKLFPLRLVRRKPTVVQLATEIRMLFFEQTWMNGGDFVGMHRLIESDVTTLQTTLRQGNEAGRLRNAGEFQVNKAAAITCVENITAILELSPALRQADERDSLNLLKERVDLLKSQLVGWEMPSAPQPVSAPPATSGPNLADLRAARTRIVSEAPNHADNSQAVMPTSEGHDPGATALVPVIRQNLPAGPVRRGEVIPHRPNGFVSFFRRYWLALLLGFVLAGGIIAVRLVKSNKSTGTKENPGQKKSSPTPPVVSPTASLITELADLEGELEFSQSERNNLSAQKSEKARMIAQLRSGADPLAQWDKELKGRQEAVTQAQTTFDKVQAKATAAEAGVQKANEVWESGKQGVDSQRRVLEQQKQAAIDAANAKIAAAKNEIFQCNTQVTEAKSAVAAEEENAKRKPEDPNADRRTQAKTKLENIELEFNRAEANANARKEVLDKAQKALQGNLDGMRRYTDSANDKRKAGDKDGAASDDKKAAVLADLTGGLREKVDSARDIFAAANTDLMMSRAKRDQAKAELDAIPSPPESTGDTRALDAARKRLRDAEKAQSEAQVKLRAAEGELKTAEGMNTDPDKIVDPRPAAQRAKVEAQKNLDQARKKLGDAEKALQKWQEPGRPDGKDATSVIRTYTSEIQDLDGQISDYRAQDKQTQARIAEVKKKIKSASAQGKGKAK